jgi:uncharacterized protein
MHPGRGHIIGVEMIDTERLADVFCRYPEIQAVYLFGSHALGRARPDSDVDLAILPSGPELRNQKLDILTDLAAAGFCNVDLVILDTDDVVLNFEAVRLNHVIFSRPDFDRGGTYSRIIRLYLDFTPYLAVQREAYKRRILSHEQRRDPTTLEQAG